MNKKLFFSLILLTLVLSCSAAHGQKSLPEGKQRTVLYFDPEIYPEVDEIREPTNSAFFSAVSDRISNLRNSKMIRVQSPMRYDSVDVASIKDFCINNNADYAVVPKVKYFKVGLGKYVFSNQVVVSMKLFDAQGNYISESNYDTYRRNVRMLGSAENSIKIGANGAIKDIIKDVRSRSRHKEASN